MLKLALVGLVIMLIAARISDEAWSRTVMVIGFALFFLGMVL